MAGLRVCVDARPLDIPYLRSQGIGRVADAVIGPLGELAAARGGELVVLRQGSGSAFGPDPAVGTETVRLRRPPVPGRLADLPEQVLLPLDLRRARADLVHSLSIYRSSVAPGVPHVMTVHDVIPLMWPDRYLRTGLVHRLLYLAARRADRLVAVSRTAAQDVCRHLGVPADRVDVAPLAADPRFVPTEPGEVPARLGVRTPYVLYVGGLANDDPRKGVGELVEAFARWASERGRPETLVLAGAVGPAGEPLREAARRTGSRIVFTGFVPDEDLPALYTGARCTVTASRYEGFGLPALESLACGTPVVAYDAGAIPEICGPGALLSPPGETATLMAGVERVCDRPDLRDRLAAAGIERAVEFSWERTAEATWSAYERAAGR